MLGLELIDKDGTNFKEHHRTNTNFFWRQYDDLKWGLFATVEKENKYNL